MRTSAFLIAFSVTLVLQSCGQKSSDGSPAPHHETPDLVEQKRDDGATEPDALNLQQLEPLSEDKNGDNEDLDGSNFGSDHPHPQDDSYTHDETAGHGQDDDYDTHHHDEHQESQGHPCGCSSSHTPGGPQKLNPLNLLHPTLIDLVKPPSMGEEGCEESENSWDHPQQAPRPSTT